MQDSCNARVCEQFTPFAPFLITYLYPQSSYTTSSVITKKTSYPQLFLARPVIASMVHVACRCCLLTTKVQKVMQAAQVHQCAMIYSNHHDTVCPSLVLKNNSSGTKTHRVSGVVAPCPVKSPLRFQRHNVSQQPALQLQLCLLCLSMPMVDALHELLVQGVHGPPLSLPAHL